MTNRDLFDIRRLFKILLKGWYKIALCFSCGLALSLCVTFLLTPKYEAWTLISSGTIGVAEKIVPIDDVPSLILRLRSPATLENILRASGKEINKQNIDRLFSDTRLSAMGNSLQLRVRDSSHASAVALVNRYFEEIKKQQGLLSDLQLAAYQDHLKLASEQKKELLELLGESTIKEKTHENFYARELLLTTIIKKETEIQELRYNMSPPMTTQATTILPVTCLPWPVSPNRPLFATLGALIGIAVGLAWVFHYTSNET